MQNSRKTYGKYRKSTEGKNKLCTNREIMHMCQVNKIGQYIFTMLHLRYHAEYVSSDTHNVILNDPFIPYDVLVTVKAAPHEGVIRTGQPET